MNISITINNISYTRSQLINDNFDIKSEFEKSTILFCRAWIEGQEEFRINTSGSTGSPKEIVISRHQMIESAKRTTQALGLKKGWSSLVCLDTKFIAGQMMLVRSIINEMNIYAVEPKGNPLEAIPATTKLNFAALVPYQLQSILESDAKRLETFDTIIIGGANTNQSLQKRIQDLSCNIYATYGMTETVSHIALQKLNGTDTQEHFHAFLGTTLTVDDRGCLIANVDFLPVEIRTNDIVKLVSEKEFSWLGRWDNVINSGGYKVIPEKVENQLEQSFLRAGIPNRFFVIGLPDPKFGQQVVLIIEGTEMENNATLINDTMIASLSRFDIPKSIHFVETFRETASGKIDRYETVKLIPV